MKVLNIIFFAVVILVLLKVDISIKPFRISWNPPFMSIFGILFIIIGWTMTTYHQVREAKKEYYQKGSEDVLNEIKKLHAEKIAEHDSLIEKIKNDTCAQQMDTEQ